MDTINIAKKNSLDFFEKKRGKTLPILIHIKAHDTIEQVKLIPHPKGFDYEIEGRPSKQIQAEILSFFEDYFCQKPPRLPFFLLKGVTPFTRAVLQKISQIPQGETRTYLEIAQQLQMPTAARAVGGACGRNPFPFFIPCHRVVGSNGLGGFSCGLEFKKNLLNFEKIITT